MTTGMTPGTGNAADATWSDVAGHLEAFIAAWESGREPDLAPYLPADGGRRRRLVLVELVKVDMEFRARAGRPRQVEHYLAGHPELSSDEGPPVELICEEYHVRRSRGDRVDLAELCDRFPGRTREIWNWLGALEGTKSTSLAADLVRDQFRPGETLDDFLLVDELGRGAFATVFLARQLSMGRLVALKVSADRGDEARTLAQLDHPNVVRVFDQKRLEPSAGGPAVRLVYEQYLPGGTLAAVVARARGMPHRDRSGAILVEAVRQAAGGSGLGLAADSPVLGNLERLSWPAVVARIGIQLADALHHAHSMGILHRDVKPANVLLAADGTVRLGDFNTSSLAAHPTNGPAAYFGGSLAYMSPEHLEAFDARHERSPAELDGRSDIYSLAVLLWELLVGRRPFLDQRSDGGGVERLLGEMVARRRRAEFDADAVPADPATRPLAHVLTDCLAPDPARRPATGAALAKRLALVLQPQSMRLVAPNWSGWRAFSRRRPFLAAAACILLPNVILAACNFSFNHRLLLGIYAAPDLLPARAAFDAAFLRMSAVVNAVSFPFGLLLVRFFIRDVSDLLGRDRRGGATSPSAERAGEVRRRLLVLGDTAAWIGVAVWMASGVAFPLGLALQVGPLPAAVPWLFMQSPVACGLLAAAYPFFLTTLLVLRVFYPALLRPDDEAGSFDDDEESLRRLARRSGRYLLVAAGVPLGTLAALILFSTATDRGWLVLLTLAGLVGLAFATWARQAIEADVSALVAAGRPLESLRADSRIVGTR
jgi:serine/threonine protein kinase